MELREVLPKDSFVLWMGTPSALREVPGCRARRPINTVGRAWGFLNRSARRCDLETQEWGLSSVHCGQGHFGKVSLYCYDPTNDGTGEMVAVKALKADCGPQLRSGWRREIDILRTLYHEHIVKYKGCCEDQGGPDWVRLRCAGLGLVLRPLGQEPLVCSVRILQPQDGVQPGSLLSSGGLPPAETKRDESTGPSLALGQESGWVHLV